MSDKSKSLLFLFVMALIVGNGLAAISMGLRERIDDNRKMMRVRSLLDVLGVQGRESKTDTELLALYESKVLEEPGEFPLYVYRESGQDVALSFDLSGRGLWDQIKGFMAVKNDGVTVRGVRFYEQNETPGLGGEIGTPLFERRFVGKRLFEAGQTLRIVKAGSGADVSTTEVDGITGATLTCEAINKFMIPTIERFRERGGDSR
ncbi:MAG: FMN-binding protein [Planctomycetota bacterium]|jgi:Na+-transporting NADH:ubiquinone oxidoreductase subunit NqrC